VSGTDLTASPAGQPPVVRPPGVLRLNQHAFEPRQLLVMAIVNRTPDSFYQPG
jgi:hypothetical protein